MFCILVFKATAFYSFNQMYRATASWCCLDITDSPESQNRSGSFLQTLNLPMVRFSLAKGGPG